MKNQTRDARMVNVNDVARLCGVTVSTVRNWREEGVGPRYLTTIGYTIDDLAMYLSSENLADEEGAKLEEVVNN